jgi:hypothetical protein
MTLRLCGTSGPSPEGGDPSICEHLRRSRAEALREAQHFMDLCKSPGTPLPALIEAARSIGLSAGLVEGFATLANRE